MQQLALKNGHSNRIILLNQVLLLVNNIVYVGSDDGYLYALDATTGTKKWSFGGTPFTNRITPTIAEGLVYITGYNKVNVTTGLLYVLDAVTGTEKWHSANQVSVYSSPCVVTTTNNIYRGIGNVRP